MQSKVLTVGCRGGIFFLQQKLDSSNSLRRGEEGSKGTLVLRSRTLLATFTAEPCGYSCCLLWYFCHLPPTFPELLLLHSRRVSSQKRVDRFFPFTVSQHFRAKQGLEVLPSSSPLFSDPFFIDLPSLLGAPSWPTPHPCPTGGISCALFKPY